MQNTLQILSSPRHQERTILAYNTQNRINKLFAADRMGKRTIFRVYLPSSSSPLSFPLHLLSSLSTTAQVGTVSGANGTSRVAVAAGISHRWSRHISCGSNGGAHARGIDAACGGAWASSDDGELDQSSSQWSVLMWQGVCTYSGDKRHQFF